jgi:hypothetical protein
MDPNFESQKRESGPGLERGELTLETLLDHEKGPMAKWYGRRLASVSNAPSLDT